MARIGFIGASGLMGHGMAKNLVTKGFPLTVRANRNRKPLEDILAARGSAEPRRAVARPAAVGADGGFDGVQDLHTRLKARETPQARFCWHCRKPLHARSDRCPFCGETQ